MLGRAYNEQSQAPQPGKSRLRRHSALEQRRISSKVKVPGVSSAMLRRVMSESSLTSRHTKGLPATMEEAPVRAIATTSGAEQSHAAAFRESLTQRPAWTGRRRSVASPGRVAAGQVASQVSDRASPVPVAGDGEESPKAEMRARRSSLPVSLSAVTASWRDSEARKLFAAGKKKHAQSTQRLLEMMERQREALGDDAAPAAARRKKKHRGKKHRHGWKRVHDHVIHHPHKRRHRKHRHHHHHHNDDAPPETDSDEPKPGANQHQFKPVRSTTVLLQGT